MSKRKKGVIEIEDQTAEKISEALNVMEDLAGDAEALASDLNRAIQRVRDAFSKVGVDV